MAQNTFPDFALLFGPAEEVVITGTNAWLSSQESVVKRLSQESSACVRSSIFNSVPHIHLAINVCRMLKSVLSYTELHRKTLLGRKKKRPRVRKQSQDEACSLSFHRE